VLDSQQGEDTCLLSVQVGCRTYPSSHSVGTSSFVPEVKQPRRDGDQSFVSST
jgi:hypothetical protein